jgi:NAD+ synthase (glutamine-hydrolysing)
MKIALAQCNFHIGNFAYNEKLIAERITQAVEAGADLVVFSELAVCGYPPYDLLEFDDFVTDCYSVMERLARRCRGVAAIVGAPFRNPESAGKTLFNGAWFLNEGEVQQVVCKALLPTYDVFDEYRYFEPSVTFNVLEYKKVRIALTICEDLWNIGEARMYTRSPMDELMVQNPDLMINIAASPFHHGQIPLRRAILAENALRYHLPLIYVNQTGAQTDLLFDGGSMVVNSKGEVVMQMKHFEEDFLVVDTDNDTVLIDTVGEDLSAMSMCRKGLVIGIRDYFRKLGFTKAVLGLSGGLDSALVMVLAAEALGAKNVTGLIMPSRYSSDHSVADAVELARNLGAPYEIISIEPPFKETETLLSPWFTGLPSDVAEENLQARIRALLLMAWSNKFGHILLNTSNKSEAAVGYGTLYGDMCGALSVIGDLYKTEAYEMAALINREHHVIPESILLKPPSAELRPDQRDEDSLPPYPVLDPILRGYIEERKGISEIIAWGVDPDLVRRVIGLVNLSEHKRRQSPPVLRVSEKAFGYGRRMPLVSGYRG